MSAVVQIEPATVGARQLWERALELAAEFGADEPWALVGGLMVQLHAFEHGSGSRLTADIDFLGDSRRRPAMTMRMAEVLVGRGAEMATPPIGDETLGYRFEVDGTIVEILGSEGVRHDPKTLGRYTTFQVPGGTQALARPSLLGAILIKARVVKKRREKFESDRQDLIRLLSFVEDPRALAGGLKTTEKRWLREIDGLLGFESDDSLGELFGPEELAAAAGAYRLLLG